MRYAVRRDATVDGAKLNPDFRYLRVTIDGRVALLVLGYVDDDPGGPVQVWYSAEREVLRIQNGRIAGATGLTTEWRNVSLRDAPQWLQLKGSETIRHWTRVRDVMPGYRYGVVDLLSIRAVPAPSRSVLQNLKSDELAWFEEWIDPAAAKPALGKEGQFAISRYAVEYRGSGDPEVVYGEQCLAPELCFTWQRWPAVPQPANSSR